MVIPNIFPDKLFLMIISPDEKLPRLLPFPRDIKYQGYKTKKLS